MLKIVPKTRKLSEISNSLEPVVRPSVRLSVRPSVCQFVRPAGKVTFGPEGLQPSTGARKKPPVGGPNFLVINKSNHEDQIGPVKIPKASLNKPKNFKESMFLTRYKNYDIRSNFLRHLCRRLYSSDNSSRDNPEQEEDDPVTLESGEEVGEDQEKD